MKKFYKDYYANSPYYYYQASSRKQQTACEMRDFYSIRSWKDYIHSDIPYHHKNICLFVFLFKNL